MIDLRLTALPRPEEWDAIPAYREGEDLAPRSTLRLNDVLVHRRPSLSISCLPGKESQATEAFKRYTSKLHYVGRDVSLEQLYPDLWDAWPWIDDPLN